jgi:cell wall-associated NlpC family hydrolase
LILALACFSVLAAAHVSGRASLQAGIASSPEDRSSASDLVAVEPQYDQALHSPVLPLTIITAHSSEIGASLIKPSPSATPAPSQSLLGETMIAAGFVATAPEPAPPPVYVIYTVQDGDTVDGLAARFTISSSSILWSNPALESADSLSVGTYLRIPLSDGIIYDVSSGDTLSDIAARFGVDVQAIVGFPGNNLAAADSIVEGQTIFVPGGTMPAPVETPVPEPTSTPQPEERPAPAPVPTAPPPSESPSDAQGGAADLARSRIGAPYVSGAAGPNAFDCSGLVHWVYTQLGISIPRSAPDQYQWASPVDPSQMQPGDIVFFENTYPSSVRITHVGIYVGGGGVVMAVDNGDIVREVSLSEAYWSDHFAGAGRAP